MRAEQMCPCGSGTPLSSCCGPVIDDPRVTTTAEQLMRSRYTARALGRWNHLWVTWHPRTRPELADEDGLRWTGLEVLRAEAGTAGDDAGVVEYRASYREGARPGVLHEVARFQRRAGRWFYVDGDLLET